MKLPLLILLFFFSCTPVWGQGSQPVKQEAGSGYARNTVYNIAEKMPSFPGGETALVKYLGDNIHYPEKAKNQNITGTVYLSFVVNAGGEIKDITILRGVSEELDNEAVRVVKAMPKWTPGEHGGKSASVRYNLPVKFILNQTAISTPAVKDANVNSGDEAYKNGIKSFNEGKYDEAVKAMTEAIRYSTTDDLDALFIRGCAYYNLHDSAAACKDWKICYHRNDTRAAERLQMHCGCFYDPEKKIVYFDNAAAEKVNYQKKKDASASENSDNLIYAKVDQMPQFPGGNEALLQFLQKNIKYPKTSVQDKISGSVYLTFVVDKSGIISHTRVVRSGSPDLDAEAIRVIGLMPPWEAGKKNGKPVNVQFNLPIQFDLKEIPE